MDGNHVGVLTLPRLCCWQLGLLPATPGDRVHRPAQAGAGLGFPQRPPLRGCSGNSLCFSLWSRGSEQHKGFDSGAGNPQTPGRPLGPELCLGDTDAGHSAAAVKWTRKR